MWHGGGVARSRTSQIERPPPWHAQRQRRRQAESVSDNLMSPFQYGWNVQSETPKLKYVIVSQSNANCLQI